MKLSKCIFLATIAISASFASANCKDTASQPLTGNRSASVRTADIATGQTSIQAPRPTAEPNDSGAKH